MSNSSAVLHRSTASPHPHATTFHHYKHPIPPPEADFPDTFSRYHSHTAGPHQCSSAVVQQIRAPVDAVWSIVRRFDAPQSYKHFIKSCDLVEGAAAGNLIVGCLRRVHVVSGLPAATSIERLEILDDDRHVISFSVVGGDHRLSNYRSVTSLHRVRDAGGEERTVVVESYVVDTPGGNTKEETCLFVDTIVRCNLQSLAQIAENLVRRDENNENSRSRA